VNASYETVKSDRARSSLDLVEQERPRLAHGVKLRGDCALKITPWKTFDCQYWQFRVTYAVFNVDLPAVHRQGVRRKNQNERKQSRLHFDVTAIASPMIEMKIK